MGIGFSSSQQANEIASALVQLDLCFKRALAGYLGIQMHFAEFLHADAFSGERKPFSFARMARPVLGLKYRSLGHW